MTGSTPRLRLFAGPNGSGKSVLKSYLPDALLGVYLNPDEIETNVRSSGVVDFDALGVSAEAAEVLSFFSGSELLRKRGFADEAKNLTFADGKMDFRKIGINSYYASVAVDFMRRKLLERRVDFTFESVMSHRGKVDLLAEAQSIGYRTYLYYVATDAPEINISRVHNRVALGGHPVPDEKIVSRYHRSLDLLMDAIRNSNRAYVFDNSTDNADGKHTWLAEIIDGRILELKTDFVPAWFRKAVLDKIAGPSGPFAGD